MDKAATPTARFFKTIKLHLAHKAIQSLFILPPSALQNGAQFGQSVEFAWWVRRNFDCKAPFFPNRERLWKHILQTLPATGDLHGYEFGVAYGYLTKWWLKNCTNVTKWFGYDTFTGLPEDWLHFKKGAFDANGKPPAINDQRVDWIIGRVEETFNADHLLNSREKSEKKINRIFFFDMDLYQPTRHALNIILPHLQPGDILYFDEAGDFDERRALVESYDILQKTTCLIGYTPMAIALQRNK